MTQDEFQDKVLVKLTRLEVTMENLVGNGQPGRIANIEKRVRLHDRIMWMLTGAWTLIMLALSYFRGRN